MALQAFTDDNVNKYHFVLAYKDGCMWHFSAFAVLRQKIQITGDTLNNQTASHLFIFGGQIVYPRNSVAEKDFMVKSSDLLYMREVDKEEYLTAREAMRQINFIGDVSEEGNTLQYSIFTTYFYTLIYQ
jgi:hypothetical protein